MTSETETRGAAAKVAAAVEPPETRVIDVPGVPRFEVAPHHCFACGTLNTSGMGLVLHVVAVNDLNLAVFSDDFNRDAGAGLGRGRLDDLA